MSHNEVSFVDDWTASASAPKNGLSDRLVREADLLLGGGAAGLKQATVEAVSHPADTATKMTFSALMGAGLALSQGRAGLARESAQMVGVAMSLSFGADVCGRLGTVGHAMADTWRSDKNLTHNKGIVGSTIGSFVVDSAIMSAGGLAGVKMARNPSFYIGAHEKIDSWLGRPMANQQAVLQNELLSYHPGTAYHQERVGKMSLLLAKELKLAPASAETAYRAGSFHDIGKVKTPLDILDFPGKLDAEQRVVMDRHATDSGAILRERVTYPERIADVPLVAELHHEQLDGKGGPRHMVAAQIPIETRINTVADVFDVLSHQRSYKSPTPVNEILNVFARGRGTQFDPVVVDAFMRQPADKVLGIMLSDGGAYYHPSTVSPFKGYKIGDLLQAVALKGEESLKVPQGLVDRFNNFYVPGGPGAGGGSNKLTEAHL